jgi:hypothetical protein
MTEYSLGGAVYLSSLLVMMFFGVAHDVVPVYSDPWDYPVHVYGWVIGLSLWGATIAYLQAIKMDSRRTSFSWRVLCVEWITAPAAGMLVFWGAESASTPRLVVASIVLCAGYAGKRVVEAVTDRVFADKDG